MAEISLRKLNKSYGDITVVHDIDLEIADKEFIILVGPSGCGKSTTLRMIAGLEEISSGDLIIGDEIVNEVAPKDRDIAMVFQNYALYPHMTVYKNMAFGLELRRAPREEVDKKVRDAADILGIKHLLNRKPKALSGGQRQRVALGRAMVRSPEVFLLDEPLSNLDAKLRSTMRFEISKLHQRLDATFIYVTHDQVEAMTMADRIVVMKDGHIQQVDTPQSLYNNPVNTFVASFIGAPQMNLFEATLSCEGEQYLADFQGLVLPLPERLCGHWLAGRVGETVTLGLRPEAFFDGETGPDGVSASARLNGRVELVEPMGAEVHLTFSCHDHTMVARLSPRFNAATGSTVSLGIDMSTAHLFDAQSGLSLLPESEGT